MRSWCWHSSNMRAYAAWRNSTSDFRHCEEARDPPSITARIPTKQSHAQLLRRLTEHLHHGEHRAPRDFSRSLCVLCSKAIQPGEFFYLLQKSTVGRQIVYLSAGLFFYFPQCP